MKKFEYKEPEFKVVTVNCEDVLTASGGLLGTTGINWVSPKSSPDASGSPDYFTFS